jgi:hypothetical protein
MRRVFAIHALLLSGSVFMAFALHAWFGRGGLPAVLALAWHFGAPGAFVYAGRLAVGQHRGFVWVQFASWLAWCASLIPSEYWSNFKDWLAH